MPKRGKDGKYHSKVVPVKGAKPIYFSAETLKEFNEKRQKIIEDYVTGKSKTDITFVEMLNEWWTVVRLPRFERKSTRLTYETTFRSHVLSFFHGSKLARAVRYADLQACVDSLAGYSKPTVARVLSILKNACAYGVAQGYMEANYAYTLRYPKVSDPKKKDPLTEEQAAVIRDFGKDHPGVAILYYTGMRAGEMLPLRWEDIDLKRERIHVSKTISYRHLTDEEPTKPKTDAGERYIPIPEELLAILRPIRGKDSEYVVKNTFTGGRLGESSFDKYWRKYLCSIPGMENVTPHWLRHNYAASCYTAGIPVTVSMVWLGHSNISVTIETYTHVKSIVENQKNYDYFLSSSLKKVAEKLRVGSDNAFKI